MKRALVVMTLLGGLLLLGAPSTVLADEDGGKGRREKNGDGDRRHGRDRDGDDDRRHGRDRDGDNDRRHGRDRDGDDDRRHGRDRDGDDDRRHGRDRDGDNDRRHGRDRDGDDDRRHRRYYYDDYYYDDCNYYRGGYYGRYDRRYRYRDCGYYGGDPYYRGGRYYHYGNGSHSTSYAANLTADQEVPQPGPSGARGTARISLDDARHQVCYALSYEGIPRPTAGHIHRGAAGTSGPVALNLDSAANGNQACVAGDPSVLQEIQSNPGGFYVNLHTDEHPDGAIRGQLAPGGSY